VHFAHRILVHAPAEQVWDFLWQVDEVCACMPGCRTVQALEPMRYYEATIEERVGPFRARFQWEISIESCTPPEQVRLLARGRDAKLGATARAEMSVQVRQSEQSDTVVEIETDLLVTGKVASLGHAVIQRKADQVVRDFAGGLEARLKEARA
jgi:carbon monoxide dehydrogenase subunit G